MNDLDIQKFLAIFTTSGFFFLVLIFLLLSAFHPIPADSPGRDLLVSMLSVCGALALSVNGFFFGSSKGSQAKDERQAAIEEKKIAVTNGVVKEDH